MGIWSFLVHSCSFSQPQIIENQYTITPEQLGAIIAHNDTTIVVLYTTWCSGARETIGSLYKEAQDSIVSKKMTKKIVLLLADDKVDTAVLARHRSWGMASYYIPSSGTSAISNRNSISQFVNRCFPKHNIAWLGIGFKVPVALIVAPDGTILNEQDEMQATRFVIERILGITLGTKVKE